MSVRFRTLFAPALLAILACDGMPESSDQVQAAKQEAIVANAVAAVPLPHIVNYFELRQMTDIYNMRDDPNYQTYTYVLNEYTGKMIFICNSIGYGIPGGTQLTNPMKLVRLYSGSGAYITMPQSEPNGLFSPATADGTWIICLAPDGSKAPIEVEPKTISSPFKFPANMVQQ